MTSKKPTKKPRAVKKSALIESLDLPITEPVKVLAVKKTKKEPKHDPVAQEPIETPKPKRKSTMEKGSSQSLAWGAKMRALKEAKKLERESVIAN